MKDPNGVLNTHICEVKQFFISPKLTDRKELSVRFTSDHISETLSISDDEHFIIIVPFEKIDKIIKDARKERANGRS